MHCIEPAVVKCHLQKNLEKNGSNRDEIIPATSVFLCSTARRRKKADKVVLLSEGMYCATNISDPMYGLTNGPSKVLLVTMASFLFIDKLQVTYWSVGIS